MINHNILTHNKRILATEIVFFIWNDDLETINTGIFVASATNNHSGHENSFFFLFYWVWCNASYSWFFESSWTFPHPCLFSGYLFSVDWLWWTNKILTTVFVKMIKVVCGNQPKNSISSQNEKKKPCLLWYLETFYCPFRRLLSATVLVWIN